MSSIIDWSASIIENFTIILFITKYLEVKDTIPRIIQKASMTFNIYILCMLSELASTQTSGDVWYILVAITVCTIYGKVFTKGTFINCLFASLIPFVLVIMINSLTLYIFSVITDTSLPDLVKDYNSTLIVILSITKGGLILATTLINRLNPRSEFLLKKHQVICILAIFMSSFLVSVYIFTTQFQFETKEQKGSTFSFVIAVVGLLIINILTYVSYLMTEKGNKQRIEYELMKLQIEQQKQSYEELEKNEIEIRKIRHDMKNNLEVCATLLEAKEYDKAKEYIDNIYRNQSKSIKYSIITKSLLINALLNNKLHVCEEYNIAVDYQILSEFDESMENDICILLGNLWNNAIEATKDLEGDKKITLEIFTRKSYLFIVMKNTIEKSIIKNNPTFKTTKKDRKNHGFGITSIRSIVHKYNGILEVKEKEDYIEFQLSLKI